MSVLGHLSQTEYGVWYRMFCAYSWFHCISYHYMCIKYEDEWM